MHARFCSIWGFGFRSSLNAAEDYYDSLVKPDYIVVES
jgi:hypothetical protein